MGGAVISCLSVVSTAKRIENPHITKVKTAGRQSVEIGEEGKGESRIRRSPSMADKTLDQIYADFYGGQVGTLTCALDAKCRVFKNQTAMMYRPIEKTVKEKNEHGKEWEYIYLKETQKISYEEMWLKMVSFGHGLSDLGYKAGSRIGLYEETRYEWLVACYGAWTQGLIPVTVYANLGDDALIYAMKEAELPVMFMNGRSVKKFIALCKKAKVDVPELIVTDKVSEDADLNGVKVHQFDEFILKFKGKQTPQLPSNPKELALIMYTSGTTGDPKGVMVSHGNVYAAVHGLSRRLENVMGETKASTDVDEQDVHIAYLPLAHILEFCAENVILMRGAALGYGNPRTLTDTSARPHGDLKEFRPTFLCGVPRIWDTIKKAVEGKLPPEGSFKRRMFDRAYEERRKALQDGYDTPFWNEKVFANPRALLGGRCKALISGGAPLSAKTFEFLTVVFCAAVGQGYGLTETCAATTIQRYYDLQKDNVGGLLSCTEVKLRDVEDAFKHTDKPNPRGEVLIRGPAITQGYYKQPSKTKEAFLKDGWFATGDVGEFQPDGTLKIIGRTKALAKNAHGEYIALETLESIYVLNDLCLPNGVCLLVKSDEAFVCALVLTDEHKATKFAQAHGIKGAWPDMIKTREFRKAAAASLAETAKGQNRKAFELVKNVYVLDDEWTPENDIMTAAMKIKRRSIDEKYKKEIEDVFNEAESK